MTRRDAREWAVQVLFELDMNPNEDIDVVLGHFWDKQDSDQEKRDFSERLVRGVCENLSEINAVLEKYALNWKVERMSVTDRNVLRMAIYELQFCKDIPPVVSVNEAVDISKYFGSVESGKFVNGILDRIIKDLDRPSRTAS